MKLFSDAVSAYITAQIDTAMNSDAGGREVRIFLHSIHPRVAYEVFSNIEGRLASSGRRIERKFKVSSGLADHWCHDLDLHEDLAVAKLDAEGWIDYEDRLTHFRNLALPEGHDLLVVVLAGIDHATDRGGLADFHTLTEEVLWRDGMNRSFEPWIRRALDEASLTDVDGRGVEIFSTFLKELFKVRPRNLFELSNFLCEMLIPKASNCVTASDFLALAFDNLHFWGLPPIIQPSAPEKRIEQLKLVDRILSHGEFLAPTNRKRALAAVDEARTRGSTPTPETVEGVHPYRDADEFLDTLRDFVERNDPIAKQRLVGTDFEQVRQVLKLAPKKGTSTKAKGPLRLAGPSLHVFLRAVFLALVEFKRKCGRSESAGLLEDIHVEVESFDFDGADALDDEVGSGDDPARDAERTMHSLLGGLDSFLAGASVKVPGSVEGEPIEKPVVLKFGRNGKDVAFRRTRRRESRVDFTVSILSARQDLDIMRQFFWVVPPHHEERVRLDCARLMHTKLSLHPSPPIPAVRFDQTIDELYFSVDADEANRVLSSALATSEVIDVLEGFDLRTGKSSFRDAAEDMAQAYRKFLGSIIDDGWYSAVSSTYLRMIDRYKYLLKLVLAERDGNDFSVRMMQRLYHAFLCIPWFPYPAKTGWAGASWYLRLRDEPLSI